jgi:hypothetical protein
MVMGICGIVKDILVVLSSLVVFKAPITTTQVPYCHIHEL